MIRVDCTLCENVYGRYAVPISSKYRPAAQAVLNGGVWEPETIEYMQAHAGRDIVHAGTYFGDFLPALAATLKRGRTLYAFEPNAENLACAEWTVALNGLGNVELRHAALGATNRTRQLQTTRAGNALGGLSYITDTPDGDSEDVAIVRLDDALPPGADIGVLQLDVEGFEEPALTGALATIARCRPILILESVPQAFMDSRLPDYQKVGSVCGNAVFQMELG